MPPMIQKLYGTYSIDMLNIASSDFRTKIFLTFF